MEDEPGLLSDVLKIIAQFGANILTIHQSIPINGMASLSLSIQVLSSTGNVSEMLEVMEGQKVFHIKEGRLVVKINKKDGLEVYIPEYCFMD